MRGWHTKLLGEVVTFQRGYDLPNRVRREGSIPVVSSAGIFGSHSVAMVDSPGVVTGRYGTIGEIFYLEQPFWPLNTTLYVKDFKGNDSKFIYYLLQTFDFDVFSGKSGVPGVNRNDLHAEMVSLPVDVAEQKAIATALSDVDALIDGLTQMITKKRNLKQAAMQQLLTCETRLSGFGGEWVVRRLGDIGWFKGGTGFPLSQQGFSEGEFPFFKVSDMNNGGNSVFMRTANNYVSESTRKSLGAAAFPAESIVFAKVGAAIFLERKKILEVDSCIDNNMAAFTVDSEMADFRYIHFLMSSIKLGSFVSTTALPSLGGAILSAIEVLVPGVDEQTAIAQVLSDMDAELAALESRLTKTRELKQGMMQELLTGKTRLIEPVAQKKAAVA